MQKEFQVQMLPEEAENELLIKTYVAKKYKLPEAEIRHIEILKKSYDARKKPVKTNLKLLVFQNEDFKEIGIRYHPGPENIEFEWGF